MSKKWIWIVGSLLLLGLASFFVSYFFTRPTNNHVAGGIQKTQQAVGKTDKKVKPKEEPKHAEPKLIYTVIQPTPQQITAARTQFQAYLDYLKSAPGKQIGSFHTSLNGDNASGRVQNIILACKKINGNVLLPGASFSFNETTGDSNNPANGWKHAIEIVNNKFVMGYGGGICQVSTTLYNAVEQAGLQVNERHMHSLSVPYIAHGKDATVDYPDLDFKFTNSLQVPVRIQTFVNGNDVISTIYELPNKGSNL